MRQLSNGVGASGASLSTLRAGAARQFSCFLDVKRRFFQIFCSVCWNLHLAELQDNLSVLITQLSESQDRLKYKHDNILARCQTLHEKVHKATKEKIEAILR